MQQENQGSIFNELEFDHIAKQHIRAMAQWAMIIVILAIVGYVISLIQAFTASKILVGSSREGFGQMFESLSGSSKTWTIVSVLIGLFINFFLFQFATKARKAVDMQDGSMLGRSFANLKAYFMIFSIIMIIMFVVVLLLAVLGGMNAGN